GRFRRHVRWRRCYCRRRGRECHSRRRRQRRASRSVRPRPRCWLALAAGYPRASAASASFPSPLQDCSHCRPHHLRWIAPTYRRRRPSRPLLRPIQPRRPRRPSPSSSAPPGLRPRHLLPPPKQRTPVPHAPRRLYRCRQIRTPPDHL
ncbi:unnamed protein product, partial [Ectocarpus sp. 13 AM-2016]